LCDMENQQPIQPVVNNAEPPAVSKVEPPAVSKPALPAPASCGQGSVVERVESKKGPFEAKVSFNKKILEGFYRMGLQFTGAGAEAFAATRPGQFAEFDLSNIALPAQEAIPEDLKDIAAKKVLLRRPFSFAKVHKDKGVTNVEVIYCVIGPATLRMTTLVKNNTISILGPLGKGYTIPKGKKRALLIAGGMGSPPLEHLAQVLTAESGTIDAIAFAGAKTACNLPFEKRLDGISRELGFWLGEFGKYSISSFVATEDGSTGFKGTVTECLLDWLKQNITAPIETIIYACGPIPMLASIAKVAADNKIDCQVCMEEMMACGIGLCQSCVVKSKTDTPGKTAYKLCCKDGPVFDAKDIAF
jgi:dihydroorotate dehydrogenase electron transfer subunit